ncbi:MAG: metal-dependent hydrolase [Candidatus Lokiarchaeota archaeon]
MMRSKPLRPENLHIIVRKIKFDTRSPLKHTNYWYNEDPVVTHFFNALQATFPEGEKLFIQAALDGASQLVQKGKLNDQLKKDMDKFIRQETNHSLQHKIWTTALIDKGYRKMAEYDDKLRAARIWFRKHTPAILRLALTAAAEHYTASLTFLFTHVKPRILTDSMKSFRGLLLYHAMEELEHKSVCYDLYQSLSGNYIGRLFGLLYVTFELALGIYIRFRYLLKMDGIWDRQHRRSFRKYLIGKGGVIRGLLFKIKSYIKPYFHPWQTDGRELINQKFQRDQKELGIEPFILS